MSAMAVELKSTRKTTFAVRRTVVVSRLASPLDVLTISDAGPINQDLPFLLQTTRVLVGVRMVERERLSEHFELLQTLPKDMRLKAPFVPSFGHIELSFKLKYPILRGEFGLEPKSSLTNRHRLRVEGHYVPWSGELVPSSSEGL